MPLALSEALRRAGEIDSAAIEAVVRSPALRGRLFALRLYQSGLVSADVIFQTLLRLGARDATAKLAPLPNARLLALVPSRLAEEGCMVPLVRTGNRLHVAMLDPSDARAIEDLALFTGFAIEPFVAQARELFRARYQAYGIPAPTPVARFAVHSALNSSLLPPPPHSVIPAVATRPAATPSTLNTLRIAASVPAEDEPQPSLFGQQSDSPLTASLAALDPERLPGPANEPRPQPVVGPDLAATPVAARSPRVTGWGAVEAAPAMVTGWRASSNSDRGPGDLVVAALKRLQTHFGRAALFLVNRDLAVGWDVVGSAVPRERFRGTLLPLEAPSTLRLAFTTQLAVTADLDQAESTDRVLVNFLGEPLPRRWRVLPLLAPAGVVGLLYVDRTDGVFDATALALADAVAAALADAAAALRPPDRL